MKITSAVDTSTHAVSGLLIVGAGAASSVWTSISVSVSDTGSGAAASCASIVAPATTACGDVADDDDAASATPDVASRHNATRHNARARAAQPER